MTDAELTRRLTDLYMELDEEATPNQVLAQAALALLIGVLHAPRKPYQEDYVSLLHTYIGKHSVLAHSILDKDLGKDH